ncbi:hypothetical protein KTT_11110 [Tengunoibacter tsumagoiensis]|uniref:Uncharacterized protein n=1 Tax=Tengunoibacter tsumagoiensis TaxID=2014871 RepID=A0A401ZWR4_9CHLR|nr:hypothetical protein KTT_11110 [Tengunoibacter tsumagoiensis]
MVSWAEHVTMRYPPASVCYANSIQKYNIGYAKGQGESAHEFYHVHSLFIVCSPGDKEKRQNETSAILIGGETSAM